MRGRDVREVGDKIEIRAAWLVAYLVYCGYQEQDHVNDGYVTFHFPHDATREDEAKNTRSITEDIADFQMFRARVEPLKYMQILKIVHDAIIRLKGRATNDQLVRHGSLNNGGTANGASA